MKKQETCQWCNKQFELDIYGRIPPHRFPNTHFVRINCAGSGCFSMEEKLKQYEPQTR